MTVKDRLLDFLKAFNLSQARFEKSINASNGYVNSMRKGLGVDKIEQIRTVYPELNINWLLTGNGEMLKSSSINSSNVIQGHGNSNVQMAQGGSSINDNNKVNELEKRILILEGELNAMRATIEAKNEIIEILKSK